MIWVDRLGFDLRICSLQKGVFDVRIPFPREVTDEKGAKSSFNCMSQQAWEVEKNYQAPEFKKVKHLKQIAYGGLWEIIFETHFVAYYWILSLWKCFWLSIKVN